MKTPKILNILGLAVALAVFMILMAQVRYDRRYNRCLADSERMYRMEENGLGQGYSHWIHDSDITDYLDSLDEVESVCQLSDLDYNYNLEHPVEGVGSLSNITLYDTLFFDFFGFQCVEGAFSELDDDEDKILPAHLVKFKIHKFKQWQTALYTSVILESALVMVISQVYFYK